MNILGRKNLRWEYSTTCMVIDMNEIWQLLKSNKEWIFSGIGVYILSGIIVWIIKRLISVRRHNVKNITKTPIPTFRGGRENTNGNGDFNINCNNNINCNITIYYESPREDSDLYQGNERINFGKLREAAIRKLESGEKIESEIAGKMMLKKPSDDEIVGGLFAATNHRMIIVIVSISKKKRISLTYEQVGGITLHDGSISVILPDKVLTLSSIDDDAQHEFEKFFKYCNDKKKPPEKENDGSFCRDLNFMLKTPPE